MKPEEYRTAKVAAGSVNIITHFLRTESADLLCDFVYSVDRSPFGRLSVADRYALGAAFKPSGDTEQVLVLSAHADAFNAAHRRTYTEALIDWATARSQSSEVFIAGDFNFELKAANETNLYTDNLKHDSESYSHILRSFRDLGRTAGDTAINDRRIDYIFGPLKLEKTGRVEVLRNAAVGRMDHWPLLVEVGR